MKQAVSSFIFSPHINIVPFAAFAAALIFSAVLYYHPRISGRSLVKRYLIAAGAVSGMRILFAIGKSILQYYVWSQNDFTKLFLPPNQSISQFLFYAWGRFGINAVLSIAVGFAFYALLKGLRRYNDRFFEDGEVELGLVLALIVGWPNFVVFVPAVFAAVVVFSIVRGVFWKEAYTTLGLPLLAAGVIAFVFGINLIVFAHLGRLVI